MNVLELVAGFFTGKTYQARDFARSHKALITNGVLADDLETFQVVPSSGMTVAIKPGSGYCWIEGHYAELESTAALTLTTADGVLNRIDRIVARLDTANAKIVLTILTGTTAATPTAPALTRNGTIHELCLADIYVAKGTTTITAAMITDTRSDSTLCGGCLVRTADLLALAGKADKVYVDAVFATKAEITAGTLKANADRLQGKAIAISNPANRHVLQYNGTGFVNVPKQSSTLIGQVITQQSEISLTLTQQIANYDMVYIAIEYGGASFSTMLLVPSITLNRYYCFPTYNYSAPGSIYNVSVYFTSYAQMKFNLGHGGTDSTISVYGIS